MAIKVGDLVYQGGESDSIRELRVERVGRKYFYIDGGRKYIIETMELEVKFGRKPKCYTNRQELEEIFEFDNLCGILRTKLERYGRFPYSLDQLRRVKKILDEEVA